jgi:flagellar hook-associated protein 1 FlgK
MSLNSIIANANSGLQAAQSGLRVTSDNIANVNTAGYVRKTLQQTSRVSGGMGAGVDVIGVTRAANSYLQLASLNAATATGRASVRSELLDNAQSLFGNPGGASSYFNRLDELFSAFSTASDDPGSNLRRTQATAAIQDFLSASSGISNSLADITASADTRISAGVARANDLLQQIERLNTEITAQRSTGGDVTGSQNLQSGMLDELATLMDITTSDRLNGGIMVRTPQGQLLAGAGAGTISYERGQGGDAFMSVTLPGGSGVKTGLQISSGEIGGLLSLRNNEIAGIGEQLGEYVAKAAEEINRAANASSAVPAPNSLTGRNTGLGADIETAVGGFTGKTTLVVTSGTGVIQRRVDIDFDNNQITVDGVLPPTPMTGDFLADVGGALGAFGSIGFANGKMTLTAQNGSGVALQDDATSPALKAGKGFSHFFGLNDIIRSQQPSDAATGLRPSDPHGFTPGDTIVMRLTDATGARQRDITVTIPPNPALPAVSTMQDLLDSLNDSSTGVGLYGSFNLSANGELTFAPRPGSGMKLSISNDGTERGAGGPSMTQMFGLGVQQRGARGSAYAIDPAIVANPARLPLGQLNLGAAAGQPALVTGDGRGALAISKAGEAATKFSAAGGSAAIGTSLSRYASLMGGSIGRTAAAADDALSAAQSVLTEANTRRQSVEGVNLDEELINMTTYQQAFNASARVIQASKDLFDTLLNMF